MISSFRKGYSQGKNQIIHGVNHEKMDKELERYKLRPRRDQHMHAIGYLIGASLEAAATLPRMLGFFLPTHTEITITVDEHGKLTDK